MEVNAAVGFKIQSVANILEVASGVVVQPVASSSAGLDEDRDQAPSAAV
jgi:hypothetical protein